MLELIEDGVTFLHIVVCLLLIIVVLIQPGKSGGISAALGGAGAAQVFGGRGAGNFMSKATWGSAGIFFATSMTLAYVSSSVDDSLEGRDSGQMNAAPAVVAPVDEAPVDKETAEKPETAEEAAAEKDVSQSDDTNAPTDTPPSDTMPDKSKQ